MPRRKGTRSKIVAPKELPGIKVTEEMSKSEREEQLEVFLKDFDFRVKKTLSALNIEATRMKLKIKNAFDNGLRMIPVPLQNMTLEEFAAAGGTFETALNYVKSKDEESKLQDIQNNLSRLIPPNTVCPTSLKKEIIGGPADENKNTVTKTVKAKRQPAAAPPPVTAQASRRSARASTRSKLTTPATTMNRPIWGATPLVTPKFNPNLPMTPENIREMHPGERLMSIAGSPVQVDLSRRKAGVGVAEMPIEEVANEFSTIAGVDLTPNRVERMLRILHG